MELPLARKVINTPGDAVKEEGHSAAKRRGLRTCPENRFFPEKIQQ
jgi:hypothetical protein